MPNVKAIFFHQIQITLYILGLDFNLSQFEGKKPSDYSYLASFLTKYIQGFRVKNVIRLI